MDIDNLIKRANQGDAEAQKTLARCFFIGKGVEQSYKEAIYWFEKAADQGDTKAQNTLGKLYYHGMGVKKSYREAVYWFERAAEQGQAEAQSYLGTCYLHGTGKEQNFKEAEKFFKKSVENGNKTDEYNTKIFEELHGKTIQQIKDISEEFDEKNVGAVLISPQENKLIASHTLYDIETYRKIKKVVNEILEDVEEVYPNKDNEFDVFIKIYTKLGRMISYNYQAAGKPGYEARNLTGGLIKGKCVCAGYAEILRNVLSCRGIECIYVNSNKHAFNQVKIGGKWYYCDLTNSRKSLHMGKNIKYCLLSKEEFEDDPIHVAKQHQTVYPSPDSYPQEKVEDAVRRIISSEKNASQKKAKKGTESQESIGKDLSEQIDRFAKEATLIWYQDVEDTLNNDNDKDVNKDTLEESSLEQ